MKHATHSVSCECQRCDRCHLLVRPWLMHPPVHPPYDAPKYVYALFQPETYAETHGRHVRHDPNQQ